MNYQLAEPKDAIEIISIMNLARSLLKDSGWYCIDTIEYVREHIEDSLRGVVLKAVENDQVAAFLLIHYPGLEDSSLGNYRMLKEEELLRVAYMDSLAVHPAYRGNGLQYGLMEYGERYLSPTPYCHLMGTVHPENKYSLNNFLKLGYEIIATAPMYGSLPRNVMYKRLSQP